MTSIQIQENKGLQFGDFDQLMRYTQMVAVSNFCPRSLKGKTEKETIANITIAVQWGMELGLTPMASIQNIAVVNGQPTVWGDMQLALVRGSGKLKSFKERYEGDEKTGTLTAFCEVQRVGEDPATESYSQEEAKKAGLWGKSGTWTTHAKRMLRYKARAFALRDNFADVLKGIHSQEEMMGSIIEAEVVTPEEKKVEKERIKKDKKEDAERKRALKLIENCKTPEDVGRIHDELGEKYQKEIDKKFNEITGGN